MDKRVLIGGFLVLILALFLVASVSAATPAPDAGKSVSYYLKWLNASLIGGGSTGSVDVKPVQGSSGGGVTLVGNTSKVDVNTVTIGGVKYYQAFFNKGWDEKKDYFCVSISENIPGTSDAHGKYCFYLQHNVITGMGFEVHRVNGSNDYVLDCARFDPTASNLHFEGSGSSWDTFCQSDTPFKLDKIVEFFGPKGFEEPGSGAIFASGNYLITFNFKPLGASSYPQ